MPISSYVENTVLTRDVLEKWIQLWGCSASEAVLEQGCTAFQDPEIPGFIGYRIESNYAIVYGDPICPIEHVNQLTQAFQRFCLENKYKIVFMIVSEKFAKWAFNHFQGVLVQIGEELVFDPKIDPKDGVEGSRLRNKISHANRLGLVVKEYVDADPTIEQSITNLQNKWLEARRGPQISLGKISFFDSRIGKRWFYVKNKKEIIAAALLCRLEGSQGWFLKYSLTIPKAPRGTSELLITTIFENLAQENCRFLTYGMVPAEQLKEIIGLRSYNKRIVQFTYKIIKWMFRLGQRKIFWQQFHPTSRPAYLVFSESNLGLDEIKAVIKGLNVKY